MKLTIFTESFTIEFKSFLNYKAITEGNLTCFLSLSFSLKILMSYNEKMNPYIDSWRRIWITLKFVILKSFEFTESCLSSCTSVFEFEGNFEAHRFDPPFWRAVLDEKLFSKTIVKQVLCLTSIFLKCSQNKS